MRATKRMLGLVAIAALLVSPMTATAGSLIVTANNGSGQTTSGITGFQTFGTDMDGMLVTATFSDSTSQSIGWTDAGGGSALGTGWSLAMSGDSFTATWTLANVGNLAIKSILLNGIPGKTVFDRTNPSPGTTDSAQGRDFEVVGTNNFDVKVTYFDILSIGNAAPVGDEYTKVLIEFTNDGGFSSDSRLQFRMDTDNATTEIRDVPEPATCTLLGIGIAGFVGYRARRRKV